MTKAEWIRVSRSSPCPICGRPDYCTKTTDGAVAKCMRIESSKPAKGDAGGWIHKVEGAEVIEAPVIAKPARKIDQETLSKRVAQMYRTKGAAEARIELAERIGVSLLSLEALEVGLGYDRDGKRFWSLVERDILWRPVGVSRRYENGSKRHLPGTTHGLYFAKDWYAIRGPILLPEGGSDTAALLTMGLCAIGRPSNTGGINMLIGLLRSCTQRPIIVIGENDRKPERIGTKREAETVIVDDKPERRCPRNCEGCTWCWPGKGGAVLTAERLTAALRRPVYSRVVKGAKDSREWLNTKGCNRVEFVKQLGVPNKWLEMLEPVEAEI